MHGGCGFSSASQKLTHPAVFCAETQETRRGEELHPVTDTAGAVRLGNDLKENHRLITDADSNAEVPIFSHCFLIQQDTE